MTAHRHDMTAHRCVCQFANPEWAALSHRDFETLVEVGTRLLAAAPTLAAVRFPGALAEWLNRDLAQQRGGERAARLKRLWRVVVGGPDDARRLRSMLRGSEASTE